MYAEYKAWHYFICAKVLPNSNFNEVTKETTLLNYAIQGGLGIDVDTVILTNFLYILKGSTIVSLGYSSFIYAPYREGGEKVVYPKLVITKKISSSLVSKAPQVPYYGK